MHNSFKTVRNDIGCQKPSLNIHNTTMNGKFPHNPAVSGVPANGSFRDCGGDLSVMWNSVALSLSEQDAQAVVVSRNEARTRNILLKPLSSPAWR